MITTMISIEYFTVGHPRIIESESPIHLALLWGFIATWWVGLILGILISIVSRVGNYPKLGIREVIPLMLKLILAMMIGAFISGWIGFFLTKQNFIYLADYLAQHIDKERHHLFLTAGWAHGASYLVGCIGGLVISFKIWRKRKN